MKPRLARWVDNRDPDSLAAALRRRRLLFFQTLLAEFPPPVRVLDVGGTTAFWETMGFTGDESCHITLLNTRAPDEPHPQLSFLVGDATELKDLDDRSYDVAFSNSVIEHLGSFDAQRSMAEEIQRVAKAFFVQTPNRGFWMEPHFLVPGFQFLPVDWQVALVRRFALGWYPRIRDPESAREFVSSHRLLDAREMKRLFPGGSIHRERFFGFTKSLIAIGRSPRRGSVDDRAGCA